MKSLPLIALLALALVVGCAKGNRLVGHYEGKMAMPPEYEKLMDAMASMVPAEKREQLKADSFIPTFELDLKKDYSYDLTASFQGRTGTTHGSYTVDEKAGTVTLLPTQEGTASKQADDAGCDAADATDKTWTMKVAPDGRSFGVSNTSCLGPVSLTFTRT